MNQRYLEDIEMLIRSLKATEREMFISKGKSRENKYLKLFEEYCSHIDNFDQVRIHKIKETLENETNAFNKLQKDLYHHLVNFIAEQWKSDSIESEIQENLDKAEALLKRGGLVKLAWEFFEKGFELLKKIEPCPFNYHLFIKVLDIYRFTEVSTGGKNGRPPEPQFKNHEAVEWITRLAFVTAKQISKPDRSAQLESFNKNFLFYSLLEALKTEGRLGQYLHTIKNYQPPEFESISKGESKTELRLKNIALLKLVPMMKALVGAYELGDEDRFREIIWMMHEVSDSGNKAFDYATLVSFKLMVLEVGLSFSFRNGINENNAFQVQQNTIRQIAILAEEDFESAPLRIEINRGLIHFKNYQFELSNSIFKSLSSGLVKFVEFHFYCQTLELVTEMELVYLPEKFDNRVRNLKNKGEKLNAFLKSILPVIERYGKSKKRHSELKMADIEYLKPKKKNVIDEALFWWINQKVIK